MLYHLSFVSIVPLLVFGILIAMIPGYYFLLGGAKNSPLNKFNVRWQRHWFFNGLALAGDYFSMAALLGICGMIAFYGYDGFLYAIGLVAGWAAAVWVIVPQLARLQSFSFASAMRTRFDSPGVRRATGISTLAICVFFLMLEFIAAGTILQPLLGLNDLRLAGAAISGLSISVTAAGAFFILWAATTSTASTLCMQVIRGVGLLIFFAILLSAFFGRGLPVKTPTASSRALTNVEFAAQIAAHGRPIRLDPPWRNLSQQFYRLQMDDGTISTWLVTGQTRVPPNLDWPSIFIECETVSRENGQTLINGRPQSASNDLFPVNAIEHVAPDFAPEKPLSISSFMAGFQGASLAAAASETVFDQGVTTTIYYPALREGAQFLAPGGHPTLFPGIGSKKLSDRLNFCSLMLALVCGAASVPQLFARFYTAESHAAARKSAVVGIMVIGLLGILTLYVGMSAMAFARLDPSNSNLAVPLLARAGGGVAFAIFAALAWIGILGSTRSLLEIAADDSAHAGKGAALGLGLVAIVLAIVFQRVNLALLLGWVFNIAASAQLPALSLRLFWKRTTPAGITASICTGLFSSVLWILLTGDAFSQLYGLPASAAPMPFNQPALVTVPLAYSVLIVVSLLTGAQRPAAPELSSGTATGA